MIALKDNDIWQRISRFSIPYPPFDRESHMDVRDVDRDKAMKLGLIDRDRQLRLERMASPPLILFDPEPQLDDEV